MSRGADRTQREQAKWIRLRELLARDPDLNAHQLAERLGTSYSAVRDRLTAMRREARKAES